RAVRPTFGGPGRRSMVSVRLIQCGNPHCTQLFYLCPWCDRGDRYCSDDCRAQTRKRQRAEAARRYWKSRRGRRAAARRQQRFRQSRAEKVTHPAREEVDPCAIVPSPPAVRVTETKAPGGKESPYGFDLDGDRAGTPVHTRDRDGGGERDDPQ